MKKILFGLIIFGILISCNSTDDNDCCVNVDIGIDVTYRNAEGLSLFEIDNGYNEANITIYHKINGEWKLYYNGNLDAPKGITVADGEHGKYLSILPSTNIDQNNYSETKIQFSESDFDIIKTEIDQSNSNTTVTKVWYNAVLKWEAYESERMFEIIK